MDDQRCPVEKYAGHFIRVGGECLPGEDAVEDECWIRKSARLDCQRMNATSVWCVGCSKTRKHNIVVRAICLAVVVLVTEVREGRMLQ